HATTGKIFVNTINGISDIGSLIPGVYDITWLTADVDPDLASYYVAQREDAGVNTELILSQTVADNTKAALPNDHITAAAPSAITIEKGVYEGQIEFIISSDAGNEKVYIEVYLTDNSGTPIDPGTGEAVGDLGEVPMTTLTSSLLNLNKDNSHLISVTGLLQTSVVLSATQRTRFHILVEKVGTGGGNKTFDVYFGTDHQTYVRTPVAIELDDLRDVDVSGALANDILKKNVSGLWVGGALTVSDISGTTDDLTEGSTNLYYTDTRVSANTDVTTNTAHTIDTANPHDIQALQVDFNDRAGSPTKEVQTSVEDRMEWLGDWLAQEYYVNQTVRDGSWTMIANKTTTDQAAPQPIGEAEYAISNESWTTNSSNSVVASGHEIVFQQNGWFIEARVYLPTI
ncbi:MAG: hypothetical protein ACC656_12210, partial [Candidatus Heimdallarchaeota archaeon]